MKAAKGVKYMLLSTVAFSLMHLTVKLLPGIPILQIILIRSLFSLVVCLVQCFRKKIPVFGKNKRLLVSRGFTGLLGLFFFFYSIQHMPLGSAITISNLLPVFTLLLASLFLKEKVKPVQWVFFFISFAGVFMIKGFDSRVSLFEVLMAVSGAFFAGTAHFIVRKLRETESPDVIILYLPLVSIPLITPIVLFTWVTPSLYETGLLLLVALFTHTGQYYLTIAYQIGEVKNVSNIYFLGTVLALTFGYFFFQETFSLPSIFGILLIIIGISLNLHFQNKGK